MASYTYDNYGNKKAISRNGTVVAQNFADASGNIIRSVDKVNNLEYRAGFDSLGRLASKDVFDLTATGRNDKWSRSVEYQYDKLNNISKLSLAYSNGTKQNDGTYDYSSLSGKDYILF